MEEPFSQEMTFSAEKSSSPQEELDSTKGDKELLREAMLDWKKKGNTQLANACSEALKNDNAEDDMKEIDDKFTEELKIKVERMEAEAAIETKEQSRERIQIKSPDKPIATQDTPKIGIRNKEIVVQNNSSLETNSKNQNDMSFSERNTILKKITNTKYILNVLGIIIFVELFRVLSIIFSSF